MAKKRLLVLAQKVTGVTVYSGFADESYRLLFMPGQWFTASVSGQTITPSGDRKNFVINPGDRRALWGFVYTQSIPENAVRGRWKEVLPQRQGCRDDHRPLVQAWPVNFNESWHDKFEVFFRWTVGGDREEVKACVADNPLVEEQAIHDFMQYLVKLFGEAAKQEPILLVRQRKPDYHDDLVFQGEASQLRVLLKKCDQHMLRYLQVTGITESGFSVVGRIANNPLWAPTKQIALHDTLERTILYTKRGHTTFFNAVPQDEFLREKWLMGAGANARWQLELDNENLEREIATPKERRDLQLDSDAGGGCGPVVLNLVKVMGTGGYGVVALARGPQDTLFAVKFQSKSAYSDERAIRERDLCDMMRQGLKEYANGHGHPFPFIVRVVASMIFEQPIGPFVTQLRESIAARNITTFDMVFVMQLAERGSLFDAFGGNQFGTPGAPELPPHRVRRTFAAQMVEGMCFLHKLGIVHRDLKPQNILLKKGHVQIADFGWSRVYAKDDEHSQKPGTLGWTAPEVVPGARCTEKGDVFSMGRTITFMMFPTVVREGMKITGAERWPDRFHHVCWYTLLLPTFHPKPECRPSSEQLKLSSFFKETQEDPATRQMIPAIDWVGLVKDAAI